MRCMYYIFCIYSPINGPLGCFYVFVIVNNASMNMLRKYLLESLLSFLLDMWVGVELLDCMVIHCLSFWGPAKLFFMGTITFYFLIFGILFIYNVVFLVAQMVNNLPAVQETRIWSLGWEGLLKKEMATHSSILAWEIPWREEPGGLQSIGTQRVRHDWSD